VVWLSTLPGRCIVCEHIELSLNPAVSGASVPLRHQARAVAAASGKKRQTLETVCIWGMQKAGGRRKQVG
jgi:hypothetical protein